MKCPYCGFEESKVIDSRPTDEGQRIRRRRECLECAKRFTTYEVIESLPIIVIKKDKSRETFNRDKLMTGLLRACEKRPVTSAQIDDMVMSIEKQVQSIAEKEIDSSTIGEMVMSELERVDKVSYIRFASVYKQFEDVTKFKEFIELLSKGITDK